VERLRVGARIDDEWSFLILRALAMLGGMVAVFLVPLAPEHQPHLVPFAWAFVAYKAVLFAAIWASPGWLRVLLLASIATDLVFVGLFVWHTGGAESHFYLLFYLLVALVAVHFPPMVGLVTAAAAGVSYALASVDSATGAWHHVSARVATLFLLGGALGYLGERERLARARAERLNQELRANEARLQKAYGDLRAMQERLVELERLATIGQMSAKVSHEVRNPLSAISLNTELLEDEMQSLPPGRKAHAATLMAAIRSQLDVLSAVTEEYLRFARLPKPRPEPTALGPLIEELAEFVRPELAARAVELELRLSPSLPEAFMDPGQIRQVLLNLIRNGMEAMPRGGVLGLRADAHDGDDGPVIEMAVQDTGIGIRPEDAERIFEPFFTTKEGGTGLGLAISRQIATDHGGLLTWEPAPGRGSIFRLVLAGAKR
jgi:signal transduction histidine kinase